MVDYSPKKASMINVLGGWILAVQIVLIMRTLNITFLKYPLVFPLPFFIFVSLAQYLFKCESEQMFEVYHNPCFVIVLLNENNLVLPNISSTLSLSYFLHGTFFSSYLLCLFLPFSTFFSHPYHRK